MSSLRAPHLDDGDVVVYAGDCIEVIREMPEASVDAIVTDPPYGIGFMGKDWDKGGRMIGQLATGDEKRGAFAYGGSHDRGYADNDSRAFQAFSEAWAREAYRVLKPGGHLLAFAGTRTYHRMVCGVEDAGFEIRDAIAWMYGSGFPKSLDVSKAIDKMDARDEQQKRRYRFTAWVRSTGLTAEQINRATGTVMGHHYTTHPTQPAIMTREHLEAIRDVVEDIPAWVEAECDKRTVESQNMAARQVVAERTVPIGPGFAGETYQGENTGSKEYADTLPATPDAAKWSGWGTALKPAYEPIVVARKPLIGTVAENVLTHGTGALNIDDCRIGTDGGTRIGGDDIQASRESKSLNAYGDGLQGPFGKPVEGLGRWPANVALDETAAAMLDEQSGERQAGANPPKRGLGSATVYGEANRIGVDHERIQLDAGGASRFFYTAKASRQDRNAGGLADNTHPTVKPTELMRWLIRLATPPGGIILDPFGGSGSTGVAARAETVRCILIERETEYLHIIRDRLAQQSLFAEETLRDE